MIGSPIEHSLSPLMHNAAFNHYGMDCVYAPFHVEPSGLRSAVKGLMALRVQGFNVTIPHKVRIMRLLDGVDETVTQTDAVNTVTVKEGRLIGHNTDGVGGLMALKEEGVNPEGLRVVILGAGGASRALIVEIGRRAEDVVILNRTRARAVELAGRVADLDISARAGSLTADKISAELKDADLLINTTPVGMYPKTRETPVERSLLHPHLTVFDAVYNPPETQLLRDARAVGAKVVPGVGMLVHQGARSFEIWTGRKAPVEVMRRAVLRRLGGGA